MSENQESDLIHEDEIKNMGMGLPEPKEEKE